MSTLRVQVTLGSLAGACSVLSVPQPSSGQQPPLVPFLIFVKVSGAKCQEHNVQCHNLTAELSPFPARHFLPDLFVTGHTGTLVLGGESYIGSQGFGIAWAHIPQGGQSRVKQLLPSSGSRASKQKLMGGLEGSTGMWLEGS